MKDFDKIVEEIDQLQQDYEKLKQVIANCHVMQANLRIRLNNLIINAFEPVGQEKLEIINDSNTQKELIDELLDARFVGVVEEANNLINKGN